MMFFVLLVHMNRLNEVYIHFMIAGHTKFSVDGMFGTLAKKLRGNILTNLTAIVNLINNHNEKEYVYEAKLMKSNLCYDFKNELKNRAPRIKGITKYHHFKITKQNNQVKFQMKKSIDDEWLSQPIA